MRRQTCATIGLGALPRLPRESPMIRPLTALLLSLAFVGEALAGPTLEELQQDSAKKKELDKGAKILDKYFSEEVKQQKSRKPSTKGQDEAQDEFLKWLAGTGESMGVDLRGQTEVVIDLIDQARIKYLENRFRKGSIEYVKVPDAKGMKRLEYAILVPSTYDPKDKKTPVVVSLHGRVINPRHPAFRKDAFDERARYTIWNNWYKTPAADEVLVIAPTTNPDGFKFSGDSHYDDLQALYRTLGEGLTQYRGDWDRVFLEVHGLALRVACEQSLVFAGIILRDRVDDRKAPAIPPDQFFMLENLNGVPFVYVADAANWDDVGKPMSEALTAAYAAAGKPGNLIVIQAQRDVDGALRGGEEKIKDFVTKNVRPKARDSFTWRFFNSEQVQPFPILGLEANYNYDVSEAAKNAPLSAKAGRLVFQVRREAVNGQDVNRVDLQITEGEGLKLALYEPLLNLDLPVTITVNGVPLDPPIEAKKFERDWEFFFNNVLPRRFFMLPALNTMDFAFPHKPQFVSPEEPAGEKPAEEAKPAEGTPAGGSPPADGEEKKTTGR